MNNAGPVQTSAVDHPLRIAQLLKWAIAEREYPQLDYQQRTVGLTPDEFPASATTVVVLYGGPSV
jgi:hypothetical protein